MRQFGFILLVHLRNWLAGAVTMPMGSAGDAAADQKNGRAWPEQTT